ncbi:MAG: hypothetical protein JXO22_10645 [Phycisphaerae bacterium]|nr:hypothetical protein [Phycisphaerae bacterium]
MSAKPTSPILGVLLTLGLVALALGSYEIDWWTIDGGGETTSAGGDYTLSGTIGQADAHTIAMTGGNYELRGGFWAVKHCLRGDANCDDSVDVFDIDAFVLALTNPTQYQQQFDYCDMSLADTNCDGLVDVFDIDSFVQCVTGTCPPCQ